VIVVVAAALIPVRFVNDHCMFVLSWLMETAPVHWSRSAEIIRPYALLVHMHILNILDFLYRMMRPLVDFCRLYLTQLFAAVSYLTFSLCFMTYVYVVFFIKCFFIYAVTSSVCHYRGWRTL